MGSIFKKTVTRPLPPGAELIVRQGVRLARWRVGGKTRTAPLTTGRDGADRIRVESSTFIAKFRDGDGIVVEISTGCRTEDAARQVLADLERCAERVRAGLITPAEARTAEHLNTPIGRHFDAYTSTLTGSRSHRENTRRYLYRLAADLRWSRLADMQRDDLERWLADQTRQGRSARSRNAFQIAAASFANWCVSVGRLTSNPFSRMPKANLDADRRRPRRAMTLDELARLVDAARNARKRPQTRRDEGDEKTTGRPAERLSGEARADLYVFLAGTGLRLNEVRLLTVADVRLDAAIPHVRLPAAITKNKRDDSVPLRSDLVAMLRSRLAGCKPADPVFEVPADLIKRFHADCRRAGIPRRDDAGHQLDLHALRKTFGSHLAAAGVPLTTAQKLIRHSDPKLTANVYTDPRLLDLAGAVEAMPSVHVPVAPDVAPTVALTDDNDSAWVSTPGKSRRRSASS